MGIKSKHCGGFNLIEVTIAVAILVIITLGALSYQYYAALHTRTAMSQMTAARTAQLLVDDWKSAGGATTYDPTNLNLGFSTSSVAGADYDITVDDLPMCIDLSYSDIIHDDESQITLREITVSITWRNDRSEPTGQADEETTMELSTYVRVEAAGG